MKNVLETESLEPGGGGGGGRGGGAGAGGGGGHGGGALCRPKDLNCINSAGNEELHSIWTWLDDEPSLRVGIVTGQGRAFSAGADLKGVPAPTQPPHQSFETVQQN